MSNWKNNYRSFYYENAPEPDDIVLNRDSSALLVIDIQNTYLAPDDDPSEAELIAFLKTSLAGYKVPKSILLTEEVKRAPNGKANYKWAKEFAKSSLS